MLELLFVEHDDEALATDKPHCSGCFGAETDEAEATTSPEG